MTPEQLDAYHDRVQLLDLRDGADCARLAEELMAELQRQTSTLDRRTAERDRYKVHSVILNTIAWKLAVALGDTTPHSDQVLGDPVEQAQRLISTLDREQVRTNLMAYQRGAVLEAVHRMQLGNHTIADVAARVEEILKAGMSAEIRRGYDEALAKATTERDRALKVIRLAYEAGDDAWRICADALHPTNPTQLAPKGANP